MRKIIQSMTYSKKFTAAIHFVQDQIVVKGLMLLMTW